MRNLGSLNNTVIHECVHWDLHRKSFALAQLYDDSLSSIGCKVAGGISGNNRDDFDWMEWQANVLTPRIQMPLEPFKKTVNRLKSTIRFETGEYDIIDIIEPLIERAAEEYKVSRTAAKIRMVDAGYDAAIGAFNYIDGRYIQPHKAPEGYLKRNQTFSIDFHDAVILSFFNEKLREVVEKSEYQYVDSHFVLNHSLFLEHDENGALKLTHYARSHMDMCCLVFDLSVKGPYSRVYHTECFLNRDAHSSISFEAKFHDGYENSSVEKQRKLLEKELNESAELYTKLTNDFSYSLNMAVEWTNQRVKDQQKLHPNNPPDKITAVEIAERAGLNEKTVRRALNGDSGTTIKTVVLICLALHLPPLISEHLCKIAPQQLNMRDKDHQFYKFALTFLYGNTVEETKKKLREHGIDSL